MTDIKNFPVAEGYVLIAFNSVLRHETIHLLDFLLSIKPNDKKPLFKVTVTNRKKKQKKIERGGMSSISTAELENLMSYINNPYEFNVAVHLIKKQKTGDTIFWNKFLKLNDKEKVGAFVKFYFEDGAVMQDLINKDFKNKMVEIKKICIKRATFVKKVLRRLQRESLLEEEFEEKMRRYLS